jgi:hypothetical protein
VLCGRFHQLLRVERSKTRLDPLEPSAVTSDALPQLASFRLEQPPHIERTLVTDEQRDLLKRKVELAQYADLAQPRELSERIEAVARRWVGQSRLQQTEPVVVSQHARRDAGEPRERADLEHPSAPCSVERREPVGTLYCLTRCESQAVLRSETG